MLYQKKKVITYVFLSFNDETIRLVLITWQNLENIANEEAVSHKKTLLA